ncbi:MAG: hypothetical protein Q7T82_07990 [Armatimonadota bacterium]|nr:hypothetical protein [Armatimonadota bacterium]
MARMVRVEVQRNFEDMMRLKPHPAGTGGAARAYASAMLGLQL